MSEPAPPSPVEPGRHGISRADVIKAVTTPLGFFVLVVLVVEAVLTVFAALSEGFDRTLLITGILVLMTLLVAVVALLAYVAPGALRGDPPSATPPDIVAQLRRIEDHLQQMDHVARYGSSGVLVAALLGLQDKGAVGPHYLAGGRTISPILLENLPETANSFYEMFKGRRKEIKLVEHHLVDNFLRNLIKALPPGSNWLGITRLQSRAAWRRRSTHPATFEFQRVAERRTSQQELNYLRLWSFQNDKQLQNMEDLMRRQQEAGLHTRYLVGAELDDISLIWIPTADSDRATKIKDLNSPIDEFENRDDKFRPLCAIKFGTPRGGKELDEMTICTPDAEAFQFLCQYFQERWREACSLPPKPKK
jgi:hypothetical protein